MCYDDNARPPLPEGATGNAQGEDLVLEAADGNRFAAYLATPTAPASAQVLILPDIRGLHQFYKDLALRFAEIGVAAIAMDYFGRTAGLTARDDSFEWMPHVQQTKPATLFADAAASLAHMHAQIGADKVSCSVGFCFGGALSFLCGTQDLGLAGVIGFYAGMSRDFGKGTLLDQAGDIRVPALGLFGGADQGIPVETVEEFDRRLDATGVAHEIVIYPGAPHSFFDRKFVEFADASADAWERVRGFIAAQRAPVAG
jgi:carboxymethylenebutenolidase